MAINRRGTRLYPMLEGSLIADPDQRRLIINEFDIRHRRYSGRQWFYRMDADTATGQAIGDLTAIDDRRFLVIERESFEGAAAQYKRIFVVDLDEVDADGFLVKREVANLLAIRDPLNLAGGGAVFRFPFQTIESVIPPGRRTLGVLNDNDYPFSNGRVAGQPDPNEFIIIRLDRRLPRPTTGTAGRVSP